MKKSKTFNKNIDNLEIDIDQIELRYQKMLEVINKLHESEHSVDRLIKSFESNSDIEKKINDMYTTHFQQID